MKNIIRVAVLCLLTLFSFIIFRTINFPSKQSYSPYKEPEKINQQSIFNLQRAIQFKTISYADYSKIDTPEYLDFIKFLDESYPFIRRKLIKKVINKYSLIYTWPGKNRKSKPIVLMGHYDVVPIENRNSWKYDPFKGEIHNGYIWGRGTLDDKIGVISIMEATEKLLQADYTPLQDVILCFGHDEEIGGKFGASAIVKELKRNNITPQYVLDEGGIITTDKIPDLNKPAAVIGTSEKGYLTLELSANVPGGHSSSPLQENTIDILSNALIKIRKSPFQRYFSVATDDFLDNIGPELPFLQKMIFSNRWLFSSLIKNAYSKKPESNATIQTTIAPVIFKSGIKDNIIPSTASLTINFRTLPGTTGLDVIDHIKKVINDNRIKIKTVGFTNESTPASRSQTEGYKKISTAAKSVKKDLITAPYLVIAATDSRYMYEICDQVYRFIPIIDPVGYHGDNERITIKNYELCISFYYRLLQQ